MKIFYLECTEDELRANRGIMDAIVDTLIGVTNSIFGNCSIGQPETEESEGGADE